MNTLAIDRETSNYWELIKRANDKSKLTLITLLSSSLSNKEDELVVETKPLKAHRLDTVSDEEMESLMEGTPVPITDDGEGEISDFVDANRGRIVKGLEKWL